MVEFKQGDHLSQGRFCGNTPIDPKHAQEYLSVEGWTGLTFCTGKPYHALTADIVVENGIFIRVENIRDPWDTQKYEPK